MNGPTSFLANTAQLSRTGTYAGHVDALRRAVHRNNVGKVEKLKGAEAAALKLMTALSRNKRVDASEQVRRLFGRYKAWLARQPNTTQASRKRKRATPLNNLPSHLVRKHIASRFGKNNLEKAVLAGKTMPTAFRNELATRQKEAERELVALTKLGVRMFFTPSPLRRLRMVIAYAKKHGHSIIVNEDYENESNPRQTPNRAIQEILSTGNTRANYRLQMQTHLFTFKTAIHDKGEPGYVMIRPSSTRAYRALLWIGINRNKVEVVFDEGLPAHLVRRMKDAFMPYATLSNNRTSKPGEPPVYTVALSAIRQNIRP